ncbi:MAG: LamG domain-containing protein [Acidobacteriota bacterium]
MTLFLLLALTGLAAESDSRSGFHPAELPGLALYVESTEGLQVVSCDTEECFSAGDGAPLERQYCDLEKAPEGCVRRWRDQSSFAPEAGSAGGGFDPPEWTAGRELGQSDRDKPAFVSECLGGHPCVRVGPGTVQARTLEITAGQQVGPVGDEFAVMLLVRPRRAAAGGDFYYFGSDGAELAHRLSDNSLQLRLGVAPPLTVAEAGAVRLGEWQLIEVHRDGRGRLRALVDGWDVTARQVIAVGDFSFRHLLSVGRARPMEGEIAMALVAERQLLEREKQRVREYLGGLYGLRFGDGSPRPRRPGVVELERRLWLHWTLDEDSQCRFGSGVAGPEAALGPSCPENAPRQVVGWRGRGLEFDGVDDEARSRGALGPMNQLYSFTAGAWLQTTQSGRWQAIVDKRDALEDGWDLYLDPEGRGFLRVDDLVLEGQTVLTDGRWHHLVGAFDGERLLLYVNGRLDRSRYIGRRRSPVETSREIAVGRNFSGRRDAFAGRLDEIRIYGRALEPQEIEALAAE